MVVDRRIIIIAVIIVIAAVVCFIVRTVKCILLTILSAVISSMIVAQFGGTPATMPATPLQRTAQTVVESGLLEKCWDGVTDFFYASPLSEVFTNSNLKS